VRYELPVIAALNFVLDQRWRRRDRSLRWMRMANRSVLRYSILEIDLPPEQDRGSP